MVQIWNSQASIFTTPLQKAVQIEDFNQAKLLLLLGASPFIDDSQQPLIKTLAYRDNKMKWWNLLASYGGMIGCDFDQLDLPPNILAIITKKQPTWGAIYGGKTVTQQTPGFEESIIDIEILKPHLNELAEFVQCDALVKATGQCNNYDKQA